MSYVLIGNFGVNNLGDDALREYFLTSYPETKWKVISARPKTGELPRVPCGIRSLFTPWWHTIHAIKKSDGLVFGGGTLFTDIESRKACILWWLHAVIAVIFRRKIFLTFQGVGPFRTRVGKWCARFVVNHSSFISVRDNISFERVKSLDSSKNIVQSFDPVFSLIQGKKIDTRSKNIFIVIPRMNSGLSFEARVLERATSQRFDAIHILSLSPLDPCEKSVCHSLADQLSGSKIVPVPTLDVLCREIAQAEKVLAQRYHGALVACALGKEMEVMPQKEGDKLSTLAGHQDLSVLLGLVRDGESALKRVLLP